MDTKQQTQLLRKFRTAHRLTGAALFVFFFLIAATGLFLGWKKHSNGLILPDTQKGSDTELANWLPMHELSRRALAAMDAHEPQQAPHTLDRIDVRPGKGIVKVKFEENHYGVQVDGATGEVLQIAIRHSDWLEALHDGSIIEAPLGIGGGYFKLFYTTILGAALLLFTITGFWLWYGPKVLRKAKRKR